jgi:hypothetical protein
MKIKIFILSLILSLSSGFYSQNYSTAIGIKSGYPGHGSLNVKHFLGSSAAVDVLAGANFSSVSKYFWAQCLFETNKNIVNMSGFNWYAGVGPSLGFYTVGGYSGKNGQSFSGMWGGVTGVLGIEHTFSSLPLNIALEGGPYINLFPEFYFSGQMNIAIRYAID